MFTLIYVVVGVGVNFAMLTMVGDAFADFLTYTYRLVTEACQVLTQKLRQPMTCIINIF